MCAADAIYAQICQVKVSMLSIQWSFGRIVARFTDSLLASTCLSEEINSFDEPVNGICWAFLHFRINPLLCSLLVCHLQQAALEGCFRGLADLLGDDASVQFHLAWKSRAYALTPQPPSPRPSLLLLSSAPLLYSKSKSTTLYGYSADPIVVLPWLSEM